MVVTKEIQLKTSGNCDMHDVSQEMAVALHESGLSNGIMTVFTPSSTSGLTTIEYEPGVVADLERLFDEIISPQREYKHHERWHDDNGHSHVRSALLGPSITVPFVEGRLKLGTWQQVIFVDFDTRSRSRRLVVQIMGE